MTPEQMEKAKTAPWQALVDGAKAARAELIQDVDEFERLEARAASGDAEARRLLEQRTDGPKKRARLAQLRRENALAEAIAAAGGGEPPCLYSKVAVATLERRRDAGDRQAAAVLGRMFPKPVRSSRSIQLTVPAVEPNDCIRCAGNLYQPTAGGVVDCPGVRVRRAAIRTNQADIPARYASATSTHVTDVVGDVMRPDWAPGDPGWWLWGPPGTGKTHALVVCARMLIERLGISVRWVRMPDLLARIRGSYDGGGTNERDILAPLESADLLILDEFCSPSQSMRRGTKWRPRDFELKVSTELVDARYDRAGGTTWITSNIAPDDIHALGLHQTERMDSRLSDESMIRTRQVGGRDRRRRQEQR